MNMKTGDVGMFHNSYFNNSTGVEAGVTFDNSFFDNCFVFLRQCKDRSFLGSFTVHKKVEIRINRSQILGERWDVRQFFVRQFKWI